MHCTSITVQHFRHGSYSYSSIFVDETGHKIDACSKVLDSETDEMTFSISQGHRNQSEHILSRILK